LGLTDKFNLVQFGYGGLVLGSSQLLLLASKNDAPFTSGQKDKKIIICFYSSKLLTHSEQSVVLNSSNSSAKNIT